MQKSKVFKDIDFDSLLKSYDANKIDYRILDDRSFLTDSLVTKSKILLISGEGALLKTNVGEVIDLASQTVNCVLGQNDPWVKANQIAYLMSERPSYHSSRLNSDIYLSFPKRLSNLNIGLIENSVINHKQVNGSDVVELAVKAAHENSLPKKNVIFSFKNSYHGQNLTAYFISEKQNKHIFMAETDKVNFLCEFDNSNNWDKDKLTKKEVKSLKILREKGDFVFAVIIEPIQVNNGVNTCSKIFLKNLREICDEKDITLIFDEVQTAFGWLGKLTAAEFYNVKPDIIALSKGLTAGNGPLSIMAAEHKYKSIGYGSGEKTNGADVRSLVAANSVLDRLMGVPSNLIPAFVNGRLREELEKGLLSEVSYKSKILDKCLNSIKILFPNIIGEVRGNKMIRGFEILNKNGKPDKESANIIYEKSIEKGVLVRRSENFIIIKPPIVISEQQIMRAFEILIDVITDLVK
jgi:4-aminobutyrate aminotransferase-like enzyme